MPKSWLLVLSVICLNIKPLTVASKILRVTFFHLQSTIKKYQTHCWNDKVKTRHRQYHKFQPQYQYQYPKNDLSNTNTNTNTSDFAKLNTNTKTNTSKNLNTQYSIPIPQYQYLLYSSFAIEKPNRYSWTNPCWWSHLPVSFATMLLLTLQDWRCMKG